MTTRKLFRGEHEIEIQINGKSYGKRSFHLV
jgi:hemin uptake protein HemP